MDALADLLRSAAPRGGVVADRRAALSLVDALRRADEVVAQVRRVATRGVPVVAVVLPSSVDAVTQLLGAVLGGHTVCFLDPGNPRRTGAVLEAVDADVVVDPTGTRSRPTRLERSLPPGYVATSSGSTGGPPKGVVTSWDCLADAAPPAARALRLDHRSRWAEPNHPTYDLAFTNWVVALSVGASLHVSGSLADRVRPLAMAARTGATHVRLAPGYVDLARAERDRDVPCGLRVWGSGGDRLSARHAEQVLGLGVETLVNTYGTSETAGFASAAAYASIDDLRVDHGVVSIGDGRLGAWRVELEHPDGPGHPHGAATGGDAVLAIRSPHLGEGYAFGGDDRGSLRWEAGRVVTGDRGSRVGDDLFCFGRAGRVVKRRGSFVDLDAVDTALQARRGLVSHSVVTRGGELVTLVEGEGGPVDEVRADLAGHLPPDLVPDVVVWVRRLPRSDHGKTDHAGALDLAESCPARTP